MAINMSPMSADEVTRLLAEAKAGNRKAESRLIELVYPELKKIASRHLRHEREGHTLRPSALVNEAYIQLAGQMGKDWKNRSHFYAVAAQLMRRILVDYARHTKARKRDGNLQRVDLTDALAISRERLDEILSINEALVRLAEFDERRCRVVELRFFGEMTEEEIAEVLQIAPRTVKRDWNLAKAWLHAELTK
jgi:RNA polymerase sigma factor (TIGR02999 family)